MIPNDHRTEADAVLEWAEQHSAVERLVTNLCADVIEHYVLAPGQTMVTVDPEYAMHTPRRARGMVDVHDSASFVAAVNHLADPEGNPPVVVYCDEPNLGLCAVLNDDHLYTPGWRDHRVVLRLRATPEWHRWECGQGLKSQAAFAEHLEDGEQEITDPSAAVMLEIAQTFHASIGATFKGGHRVSSGARQFVYQEDVQASAGKGGTIEVPDRFELALRPFVGSRPYKVTARLRYRVTKNDFQIGYQLVRPEDIQADAFRQVVADAADNFDSATDAGGVVMLNGPAPANATASGSVTVDHR